MRKLAIILAVVVLTVALSSCGGPKTPEEIEYAKWQTEQAQIQADKNRAQELERLKIQAEIEKAKPEAVKVQELKNQETTIGEGISEAVGWASLAAIGLAVISSAK